jgi:acyl-ACP thioesterase
MFEMVGTPNVGRSFVGERRVRLGDCSPGGRLRLDATARYLQDLSDDDTRDAGLAQMTWVVRKTVIDVRQFPTYLEPLQLVTWCSRLGSRWAERRVDGHSAGGGSLSSATLWVHLDPSTLRPTSLTDQFDQVFAPSAAGRSVSTRLSLGEPPQDLELAAWPTRFADFDVMEHMNNAAAFVVVEEVLSARRDLRAPLRVVVEYRAPIDRGMRLRYGGVDRPDSHEGWLVDEDGGSCRISYRIGPLAA